MREEGVFALYKGVTPVMLRAFPANAVSMVAGIFAYLEYLQPITKLLQLISSENVLHISVM